MQRQMLIELLISLPLVKHTQKINTIRWGSDDFINHVVKPTRGNWFQTNSLEHEYDKSDRYSGSVANYDQHLSLYCGKFTFRSISFLRVLSECLILIGSAMFDAVFNLVTHVGLP